MPQIRKFTDHIVDNNATIIKSTSTCTSSRGFSSIDQEMEREIAIQWFLRVDRTTTILKRGSYKIRG